MPESEEIRDKYIKLSNECQIMMGDELIILEHLVKKFNFISQSKYAKINGITPAGAKKRLESGKEPYIIIDGVKYVVN
jgi:hypothetical protein